MFINGWTDKYKLLFNNCQHFAKVFSEYLRTSSCNQQGARDLKQNKGDREILMKEIDGIHRKRNKPIVIKKESP